MSDSGSDYRRPASARAVSAFDDPSYGDFQYDDASNSIYEPSGDAVFADDSDGGVFSEWRSNFRPRLGIQHRSQGYGYDHGYTAFDGFAPLFETPGTGLTFLDGRFLLDNGGNPGTNVGLYHRHVLPNGTRTLGGGVSYDLRRSFEHDFHQASVSLESLGTYVDVRGNGYIPFGNRVSRVFGVENTLFGGRSLLINPIAAQSMTGFDLEAGGPIPGVGEYLRGYLGGYHFRRGGVDDVWGVQSRLEVRLGDMVTLQTMVTNDGTFGTRGVIGIAFTFPGTAPRSSVPNSYVANRLAEPIIKNHNVVVTKEATHRLLPAHALDGSLLDVVHVNPTAAPGGDGSVLSPFQTLGQAQTSSLPGGLVFGHANSTFTGQSIVLKDGQTFIGEGRPHTIATLEGELPVPYVTDPDDIVDQPTINGAPGNAVTLANRNKVAGWNITGSGGGGIVGAGVHDVELRNNVITFNAGDAVSISDASGKLLLFQNRLERNGGAGLFAQATGSNELRVEALDNSFLTNQGQGVYIRSTDASDVTIIFRDNSVRHFLAATDTSHPALLQIEAIDASRLVANIDANYIDDVGADDGMGNSSLDVYFHQMLLTASSAAKAQFSVTKNELTSNRSFRNNSPASGPFGIYLSTSNLAEIQAKLQDNTSTLNYAVVESQVSVLELEDTRSTNTGTFYFGPSEVAIDTIPVDSFDVPEPIFLKP